MSSYRSERQSAVKSQAEGREIGSAVWSLIWSAPDAINLSIRAIEEGEEQDFRLIAAEDRVFAKQSTTGDVWKEYGPQSDQLDPEARGILSMVATYSASPEFVPAMDEADLVGREFIDGLGVYYVAGTKSVKQKIPEDIPADVTHDMTLQMSEYTYHLYVNASDLLPRRLITETDLRWETPLGEPADIEAMHIKFTDNFLDYNAPVTIELPEVSRP